MRSRIRLKVECRDSLVAVGLMGVLSPDNRALPRDQRLRAGVRGTLLSFEVRSPRPLSAASTVESILADSKLFQEIWTTAAG